MKSYHINMSGKVATVLAASPRKALYLATQSRAIPASAWNFMKEHTTEGFYGPLSIQQNHGSQLVLPFINKKEF